MATALDDHGDARGAGTTVVVVGAGVAGLAAAWQLSQATGPSAPRVMVLESSPRVGGKLALGEVAGVPVDLGAESLLARRPEAVGLARQVGLGDLLQPPAPVGARLWSRGALRALPRATMMGVPSSGDGLDGLLTKEQVDRLLEEPHREWVAQQDDLDVASFVAGRVGRAVVERLVEPLLGGVYAGRADLLSLRATLPGLWPAASRGESIVELAERAARSAASGTHDTPVFNGIVGGVGRLPLAVADALGRRGVEIRTRATVRRLERVAPAGGWRVVYGPATDEQVLVADAVVLAVPGAPAARLLAGVAPEASDAVSRTPYASMAIVTFVLPREGLPAAIQGSGFLVPPVEELTIKAATFSFAKWPWQDAAARDRVALRVSVGRYQQESDLQMDDDRLAARVRADLAVVLGSFPEPLGWTVTRWGGGLPQYLVGHLDRVAQVRSALAAAPGLAVCGAAYDGVGVPACIASGTTAAGAVLDWLRAPADASH